MLALDRLAFGGFEIIPEFRRLFGCLLASALVVCENAITCLGTPVGDSNIKVNHVQGFATGAGGISWPAVVAGVVARMNAALPIKVKSDSQHMHLFLH